MEFFTSAVDVLKILVIALGAGLGIWSKEPGYETVDGRRRCRSDWNDSCSPACESVFLIIGGNSGRRRKLPVTYRLLTVMLERK